MAPGEPAVQFIRGALDRIADLCTLGVVGAKTGKYLFVSTQPNDSRFKKDIVR